ncbi:MAG TPA: hypothetical protein VLQ80_15680, partial [Candidatus Saccharimonadia bacterium]|nr:hypothetical protein [Candidatus Saccharimonadia bacterium]
ALDRCQRLCWVRVATDRGLGMCRATPPGPPGSFDATCWPSQTLTPTLDAARSCASSVEGLTLPHRLQHGHHGLPTLQTFFHVPSVHHLPGMEDMRHPRR